MGGLEIYCTHNPQDSNNFYKLNLVGHVHTLWKSRPDIKFGEKTILINVGVDVWDFYPVSLNEILDEYAKYIKNEGL
jgi:calcineurin-like phosphoesterase family protein